MDRCRKSLRRPVVKTKRWPPGDRACGAGTPVPHAGGRTGTRRGSRAADRGVATA